MQQLAEDQTPDIEHRKWTIHPSERYTSKDNTRLCSTCLNDHRWFHSNSLESRPPFPINANPSGGGSSPRSCRSSGSFFCTQQTHYIILSFVFTMKSMGSKLRKIKGHRVCHLETLLPSLLTHPEKGHAIIYLIPPPSRRLSSPSCTHPPSQPASRAMNTLRGLRAVLWTTCAVFTWLSRERVRKTGTLKPNRCMIQRRELWRVNFLYKSMLLLEQTAAWSGPRAHLHALWLFSLISQKMHFPLFQRQRKFCIVTSSLHHD